MRNFHHNHHPKHDKCLPFLCFGGDVDIILENGDIVNIKDLNITHKLGNGCGKILSIETQKVQAVDNNVYIKNGLILTKNHRVKVDFYEDSKLKSYFVPVKHLNSFVNEFGEIPISKYNFKPLNDGDFYTVYSLITENHSYFEIKNIKERQNISIETTLITMNAPEKFHIYAHNKTYLDILDSKKDVYAELNRIFFG